MRIRMPMIELHIIGHSSIGYPALALPATWPEATPRPDHRKTADIASHVDDNRQIQTVPLPVPSPPRRRRICGVADQEPPRGGAPGTGLGAP